MGVHVLGIRHHGPGSARAVVRALDVIRPDLVLVEGPPDADAALTHVASERLVPPVALLVHALDEPLIASFYPFASFSPEWRALSWAAVHGVPARFMDLPCATELALRIRARDAAKAAGDSPDAAAAAESADPSEADDVALMDDPIGVLAEAAGYADHEQWWDREVEQRRDATGLFTAILEAMTALREARPGLRDHDARREAHMRTVLRAAEKVGAKEIAVVCGAWHAPAILARTSAKSDAELLKGLPKTKVAATWIPWTHSRLAFRSGYGAGVDSPGWYAHVFEHGDRAPVVWATLAARLLRGEGLDASSANVIETVRLARALATVRDLPTPGLCELREAIEAVLCGGERQRLALIRAELEIGDVLGAVPEGVGQVPIARDFEHETRRLRVKLSGTQVAVELDLRKDTDLDRSRLFHRLGILGVAWARPGGAGRGAGTFREGWTLEWKPELMVELIAANVHGSTIAQAAARRLADRALQADLADLGRMVEVAVLAHLPTCIDGLLRELDARAGTSTDVVVQMRTLGPLARLIRYGDVRETRADHVRPVLDSTFQRVVVGLPPACSQLDDAAAAVVLEAIDVAHGACLLLDSAALRGDWLGAIRELAGGGGVHRRIAGRACRLLLEQHELAEGELARRASLALSSEPADAARWIEGLVSGQGLALVHDDELVAVVDGWVAAQTESAFQSALPLLRRAFSGTTPPERRALAAKLRGKGGGAPKRAAPAVADDLDPARFASVLPVLAQVLGVTDD